MGTQRGGSPARPVAWGRGRLLAALGAAALVAAGLLAGLVFAAASALADRTPSTPPRVPPSPPHSAHGTVDDQRQDALAAAPMPTAAAVDALPHALAFRAPGVIILPPAAGPGPAGVPTGFPRTPEGALAQLAAIDVTAMQTGSTDGVRQVIEAWAAPGGPTGRTWSGVRGMAILRSDAGLTDEGSARLAVVAIPAMGLIKGTVGAQFAVVCVDLAFTVTVERTARIAVADCQRMTWAAGRWLVGPGPEPAAAPSVWPGTDTSIAVGYRELRHA